MLILAMGFSLLPDLDSVLGVFAQDFGRFHNNLSHSLIFGIAVSLLLAGLFSWLEKGRFVFWFSLLLLSYELHVVMDFLTYGRGVMAFWPFTAERFISPVLLFFGLHWSEGFFSFSHIITLVTELLFSLVMLAIFDRDGLKYVRAYLGRDAGAGQGT